MSVSASVSATARFARSPLGSTRWARVFILVVLLLPCGSGLLAQESQDAGSTVVVDKQTLQRMLQRIDQLEARVQQLEADKAQAAGGVAPAKLAQASAPEAIAPQMSSPATVMAAIPQPSASKQTPGSAQVSSAQEMEAENPMAERMDFSKTLMRIRGFGDISFLGGNQQASPATNTPAQTNSFALGELDLFLTSDISDKFNFLSELVFEAGPENIYGVQRGTPNIFKVEPERYLIQYSYNDYLKISAGRWHTAIGYYNTAYHHSTWFQTTTDRPFIFNFEDNGGILPTHTVGVSATGLIPSGPVGLHYVVEMGNGRASQAPLLQEPVQNEVNEGNHLAYNLAVFARPESVRGLQTGFSVYRDLLTPANAPKVDETIMAAHVVLERPKYEWLNEALVIRHSLVGASKIYATPAFYTQVSRQFGSFRPYFRYQYVNVARTEPVFPAVGLQHGPSAGIRFDASEFVAVKLQYDHTFQRQEPGAQPAFDTATLQIGFTF